MTPGPPNSYSQADLEAILRDSREYIEELIAKNEAEARALREQLSELHADFEHLSDVWRARLTQQEAENAALRAQIKELQEATT